MYSVLLKEWLPLPYPSAQIEILKGDPKQELPDFINLRGKTIVVMGLMVAVRFPVCLRAVSLAFFGKHQPTLS